MADTTAPVDSTETSDFTEYQERYIGSRESDSLDALSELAGEVEGDEGAPAERSSEEAPEGKEPEATTTETAADPQDGEAEATAEPDVEELLATATPLDYTVNGESKTFDGISVIPGQGAIVPEASLPALRDRLQQAESARADARNLYGKLQDYETLQFKDRGGAEYKGRAAFENMYLEHAKQNAAIELFAKTISDPNALAGLLTYDPQSGGFKLNPDAIAQFRREIGITARETELRARDSFATRVTASQQQTEAATRNSSAISQSISHWSKQFPSLTPDDITKANAHFARIGSAVVRPATVEEAQQAGVRPGELVIDHALIHEYLQDRAALRGTATTAATTASKTEKENAQRLNAAKAGAKPNGKKPATTQTKQSEKKRDYDPEQWQRDKDRRNAGLWASDDES